MGTRDVPTELQDYLVWVGHCMALLGGVLCTGDAVGSDYLFLVGYDRGKSDDMSPAQIYYTRLKNQRNLPHDPLRGYHEAEQYDTYIMAQDLAYEARGSFEGLYPSGIALHTRNAFQVLSETLDSPRWITVFFAKPAGKRGNVKGGTNTAVAISRKFGVRLVNLYLPETRRKFTEWIIGQLDRASKVYPSVPSY